MNVIDLTNARDVSTDDMDTDMEWTQPPKPRAAHHHTAPPSIHQPTPAASTILPSVEKSPTPSATPSPTPPPAEPYPLPPDLKARIKRTYDHIGPAYNSVTLTNPLQRIPYLERFLSYVHASPPAIAAEARGERIRILELGCGSGVPVMEKLLQDGHYHVVGNDISTTQIMLGKALVGGPKQVDWVEADMMDLPFPDGSFDAVMAFYSLFHLPREEQSVMFQKIKGWLRPGGYVIMNFASQDMEGAHQEEWFSNDGWMFWSSWPPERTLLEVGRAGLEIVVQEEVMDDQPFLWVIARAPEGLPGGGNGVSQEAAVTRAWERIRQIEEEHRAQMAALG